MARKGIPFVAQKNGRGRPKKKFKDPLAPKRPPSAFFRFVSTVRNSVQQDNPNASVGEIGKIFG